MSDEPKYPDTPRGKVGAFLDRFEADTADDVKFSGVIAGNLTPDDPVLTVEALRGLLAQCVQLERKLSWPDAPPTAEQDGAAARIAELERELLALRGTELNPSTTILDAQSYRELADEIAATMTDGWDGEDSEPYILIQYVRWLAARQPRDEDGYPVRRETYPAREVERDGDARAVDALITASARHDWTAYNEAFAQLRKRFINRIAALDARDVDGSAS